MERRHVTYTWNREANYTLNVAQAPKAAHPFSLVYLVVFTYSCLAVRNWDIILFKGLHLAGANLEYETLPVFM